MLSVSDCERVKHMRQHIIDVARAIITHKGYSAVGISEIVKAADIPKGSFYYYFPSKEAFAEALLEHYFSHYLFSYWSQTSAPSLTTRHLLSGRSAPWVVFQKVK